MSNQVQVRGMRREPAILVRQRTSEAQNVSAGGREPRGEERG